MRLTSDFIFNIAHRAYLWQALTTILGERYKISTEEGKHSFLKYLCGRQLENACVDNIDLFLKQWKNEISAPSYDDFSNVSVPDEQLNFLASIYSLPIKLMSEDSDDILRILAKDNAQDSGSMYVMLTNICSFYYILRALATTSITQYAKEDPIIKPDIKDLELFSSQLDKATKSAVQARAMTMPCMRRINRKIGSSMSDLILLLVRDGLEFNAESEKTVAEATAIIIRLYDFVHRYENSMLEFLTLLATYGIETHSAYDAEVMAWQIMKNRHRLDTISNQFESAGNTSEAIDNSDDIAEYGTVPLKKLSDTEYYVNLTCPTDDSHLEKVFEYLIEKKYLRATNDEHDLFMLRMTGRPQYEHLIGHKIKWYGPDKLLSAFIYAVSADKSRKFKKSESFFYVVTLNGMTPYDSYDAANKIRGTEDFQDEIQRRLEIE